MHSCRVTLTWLVVLAAVLLSAPSMAMAGGPSAGDNQYTDPLAGSQNGSGGSHTSTGGTPQTPTPAPTASSSSGSSTTPLSSSSPTSSTAPGTTSTTTAAATASANSSSTLPRTGFDAGLAAAIGAGMVAVGLVTRRRIRCSER